MVRAMPLAARRPLARDSARLGLVEFLLSMQDLGACAERGVEWLVENAGVRQAVCATLAADGAHFQIVASTGVPARRLSDFTLDLDDHAHPLVQALAGTQPLYFARGPAQPRGPLDAGGYFVIPLRARASNHELAAGLLFVGANAPSQHGEIDGDVRWTAEMLGEKLARLHARSALAESQFGRERKLLYDIINAVTDPILLTDTEGKLIIANARAENLFAAPDDASEGRRRAVGLNNMLFTAALSSRVIEHAAISRRELLLVDPVDGSDLLFELLSSPVDDRGESALESPAVVSILRNVTDLGRAMAEIQENYSKLRLAEAEVRAERHRLDLIIDSVADPILVTNDEGDIVLMNDPAERLFSALESPDADVHRRVRANQAHFSSFASNLLFGGTDLRHRGEMSLFEPATGSTLPVEAMAGKILSEHGELTAVVTILHDRTEALEKARLFEQVKRSSEELEAKVLAATAELAQQNELLRRQAIQLEQASALKSQFLANMSHEFRTPLNAILGYTNMMLQGVYGGLEAPQRKTLQRVDSNSRHLLTVINEILDITRIEAGRMPLHVASFRVDQLVAEVLAELDPIVSRSHLKVVIEVPARLPRLRSDRQKVKQILLNLLSNALKFTPEGWVKVKATHASSRRAIAIAVSDSGIGIDLPDRERVFEDFRQVDNSPSRPYGGTGLGLSICRRLAAMLDGKITLESKIGHGSTFTLVLPCRVRRR
jgi:PAS domain S-box-containing protein